MIRIFVNMRFIKLLLLLFLGLSLRAQTDSIKTTQIVTGLLERIDKNPNKAKPEIEQLKKHQKGYTKATYYYHFYSGYYHLLTHHIDSSVYHYKQAKKTANVQKDIYDELKATNWIANHYFYQNKFKKAEKEYRYILKKAQEINDISLLIDGYYGVSIVQKDQNKALEYLLKIDSISVQDNYKSAVVANTYQNIGDMYLETLEDTQKGMEYLEKSLQTSIDVNYTPGVIFMRKKLGEIALEKQELDKAKHYFTELLLLGKSNSNPITIGHALLSLSRVDKLEKKSKKAIKKLNDAIAIFKEKKIQLR